MLLISEPGLVEEKSDGFHLFSSFLMKNFKSFQEK